jgi:hypothetical protein
MISLSGDIVLKYLLDMLGQGRDLFENIPSFDVFYLCSGV